MGEVDYERIRQAWDYHLEGDRYFRLLIEISLILNAGGNG